MSLLPRAKVGLVRHPLDDQVLVYSSGEKAVHLLDKTTATVLDLVEEGGWTREGAVVELEERLNLKHGASLLALALSELRSSGLIELSESEVDFVVDRREMLKKVAAVGIAAVLIPSIATVTAKPAFATSGGTGAACTACTSSSQCLGTCGAGGACSGGTNPNGFPTGSTGNTITNPTGNCGGGGAATRQAAENAACCDGSATETACSGSTLTFSC